ncbi:MAG: DUF362 domain-containing protein [archaeon]|jgi:hypothetical protein
MPKVYLKKIDSYSKTKEISSSAAELLEKVAQENGIKFRGEIPIKVHFGERGNATFIGAENFKALAEQVKKSGAIPFFTDTNVLYKGERIKEETHIALAKKHNFDYLPIKIADGKTGDDFKEVEINKKHFKKCRIGKKIADANQMIVLAHFKGHMLAGFGGALKQLGMGCASRAGKLAMHSNSKPALNPLKCKKCKLCVQSCPSDAIIIDIIPRIDSNKCTGCAKCIAVCPNGAMNINWLSILPNTFTEKLAEYAYAAQKDKEVIYINFVLNITKDCDCMGHKMKPIYKDLGVLASTDAVALDKACFDLLSEQEGKKVFGGEHVFDYAEENGLGKKEYTLIKI